MRLTDVDAPRSCEENRRITARRREAAGLARRESDQIPRPEHHVTAMPYPASAWRLSAGFPDPATPKLCADVVKSFVPKCSRSEAGATRQHRLALLIAVDRRLRAQSEPSRPERGGDIAATPMVVICESVRGRSWCACAPARYVREPLRRAPSLRRARQDHDDGRLGDDDGRQRGDERPLDDDARSPDALGTSPLEHSSLTKRQRYSGGVQRTLTFRSFPLASITEGTRQFGDNSLGGGGWSAAPVSLGSLCSTGHFPSTATSAIAIRNARSTSTPAVRGESSQGRPNRLHGGPYGGPSAGHQGAQKAGIAHAEAGEPHRYPGRKPNFDRTQLGIIRDLLAQDDSPTAIAEATGVSRQAAYPVQDDPAKAETMLAEWGMEQRPSRPFCLPICRRGSVVCGAW